MRGRSRRWPRLPEHLKSWNERCISARQPSSQRWRTSAARSRRLAPVDTFAAAALKHVPFCLFARALLRHFTRTTCHISHIPVSTHQLPDRMISISPLSVSLLPLALSCPSCLPIYLSAGPAGSAFISTPGEGTHPKQLQLYRAGSQPWQCH